MPTNAVMKSKEVIEKASTKEAIVITIDGPAGAGKSTTARELARRLNFSYLDTGAMYRALTLKALENKINLEDEEALVALAHQTTIDLKTDAHQTLHVLLDGRDVSEAIRSVEITNNTFYAARAPKVRAIMVEWQRRIGAKTSIVVEGRDAGTVIFPNAKYKFYLDADFNERCQRRIKELQAKGEVVNETLLKQDLQERDQKDFTRKVGPLKKADDAIVIDSTGLTVPQSTEKILKFISI